ncbi:MAG: hypothetical protein KDB80_06240 [Planctomycetes bacterium]|nr:hypothetical protein [Planctomycetota bacterium]
MGDPFGRAVVVIGVGLLGITWIVWGLGIVIGSIVLALAPRRGIELPSGSEALLVGVMLSVSGLLLLRCRSGVARLFRARPVERVVPALVAFATVAEILWKHLRITIADLFHEFEVAQERWVDSLVVLASVAIFLVCILGGPPRASLNGTTP